MKKTLFSLAVLASLCVCAHAQAPKEQQLIEIVSGKLKLSLMTGSDARLYQLHFGAADKAVTLPEKAPRRETEFFPCYGNGTITEPACEVLHTDGNTGLDLVYVSTKESELSDGGKLTTISMRDPLYKVFVDLNFRCYPQNSVMEMWSVLRHDEKGGSFRLRKLMSCSPQLKAGSYYLTQFSGRYKREGGMTEEKLTEGIKVLDSKLGVRANYYRIPSAFVSLGAPMDENSGEVFLMSLRWPGSFTMEYEVDWNNTLRSLIGINPVGSEYLLERGASYTTPAVLWAYSDCGAGALSRGMHEWACENAVRDAAKPRPILLNNWEATHCKFDEQKISELLSGAKEVGVELFLLDDGWFGNGEFARDDDKHGLGDWTEDLKKLPNGLKYLADDAVAKGIGFGIWIEPEMVNPKSQLYTDHPDWIITQKGREPILGRYQEVLDLTRPEVQKCERDIIDNVLGRSSDISYVKWDCNRYITQPGSSYQLPQNQTNLMTDYNWALLSLMDDFAKNHPDVMAMVCAGGSGRLDYGSLQYFHSFWPSDNTDPVERIKIQWGFSHIFPACTIASHVTRMGKRPMKFAIDVALSGMFGIDLDLDKVSKTEKDMLKAATKVYKEKIRPVSQNGELYRLLSPYKSSLSSVSYVSADKSKAVVFIYQRGEDSKDALCLEGLEAGRKYKVSEINVDKTRSNVLKAATVSGSELMDKGIRIPALGKEESVVIYLESK